MEIMEIVLLIAGAIVFALSFLLPVKEDAVSADTQKLAKEEIHDLVSAKMGEIKEQVDDTVDEAITYAIEKTERSLERISNEKIMAVNEYSDTVMQEIHRNHEEVMFLYDMLNDKHKNLKKAATEVEKTVKEAEHTILEVSKTAQEAVEAKETAEEAFRTLEPTRVEVVTPEAVSREEAGEPVQETLLDREVLLGDANNNDVILAFHKMGKSDVQIAKELGLGVGEVRLVLNLFQ